jgi:hypothetical protein
MRSTGRRKTIKKRMQVVQTPPTWITMVAMGVDLQLICLADRLLTGLGQPHINQ